MDSASKSPELATPSASAPEPLPDTPAPVAAVGGLGPRERLISWLVMSALATAALAWIAVQLQTAGFAPVVLLPLLTGVAVAASIEGLACLAGVRLTRLCLAVACVGGLLVVAAEDYIDYCHYQGRYEALLKSSPKMELFRGENEPAGPASFGRFMQIRLTESPVWWTVDAVLTIAAALSWTVFRLRSITEGQQEARRTDGKG